MIGALLKVAETLSLSDVEDGMREKMGDKLSEKALEGNVSAIHRAYEEVKSEND